MTSSFYNGVSGIKTNQFGVDVWADNIANINNSGYKAQVPEFSNIFSQTLANSYFNPVSSGVGLGSTSQTTAMDQTGGSFTDTDSPFDMALDNEGWFGTSSSDGNTYYTRKGEFSLDGSGNLVTNSGNFVLGTMGSTLSDGSSIADTTTITMGEVSAQTKIQLPPTLTISAVATTEVSFKGNLDPTIKRDLVSINLGENNYTQTLDTTNETISFQGNVDSVEGLIDPKEGNRVYVNITDTNGTQKRLSTLLDENLEWTISDYDISGMDLSQSLTITASITTEQEVANTERFTTDVISADGDANLLVIDFTKKIPSSEYSNTWDAVASIQDENGNILQSEVGEIAFNENGSLKSSTISTIDNNSTAISLSFGAPYNANTSSSGFEGVTSVASGNYGAESITSNGYKQGNLTDYALDNNGQIRANFDNSKSVPVAKIAVYHFQNDQGLTSEGGDYFLQSANSGEAIFYKDSNGNYIETTNIKSQKLEMSNVKLSTALTEIIVLQRAYDASSKSITTSDELIQNAINMKQ